MTPVYSGGLVYEYTNEPDNEGYGLVQVSGSSVSPIQPGFNNLMNKLKANDPSGTGGYKTDLPYFTDCPAQSSMWNVKIGNGLPALPNGALQYMKNGAGKGPGLTGSGSQTAGDGSKAVVTQTSSDSGYTGGASSSGSSGSSGNAAPAIRPVNWQGPLATMAILLASTAFGACLL